MENYTGQTYVWTSDDNGATWTFRPRLLPAADLLASGFSDPEIAIDSTGQVFFSEINLVNVAVSKSTNQGSNWTLQNFGGALLTDRQWMEADRKDELYFVANGQPGGTGTGIVDRATTSARAPTAARPSPTPSRTRSTALASATSASTSATGRSTRRTTAEATSRSLPSATRAPGNLAATDTNLVAAKVSMLAHWPAIDLDPLGQPLHHLGRGRHGRTACRHLVLPIDRRRPALGRLRSG